MDQMASNLGQEGKLLALLCRPAEIQGLLEIPDGMECWGIDSVSAPSPRRSYSVHRADSRRNLPAYAIITLVDYTL